MAFRKERERMKIKIPISISDKILSYEYRGLKNRGTKLIKLNISEVKK